MTKTGYPDTLRFTTDDQGRLLTTNDTTIGAYDAANPPVGLTSSIPSGQAVTPSIDLFGQLFTGVGLPDSAGWTSANLTFRVSVDGGLTFRGLYKDGAEYTVTVPTGRANPSFFAVDLKDFAGFTHIVVRSGTVGTPVNQAATRTIQIGRMP